MIAFVGSVFSPYYAWSGRKNPENHCALNVALYGGGKSRWAMTERAASSVKRDANTFQIGPSQITKDGNELTFEICETGAPIPYPVRGTVRIRPEVMTDKAIRLDSDGYHMWWPIAPRARIEVAFERPALKWSGWSYLDTNAGVVPLESSFSRWDWCRANFNDGAAVLYDVEGHAGHRESLALWIDDRGQVTDFLPPRPQRLDKTLWRVPRQTQVDEGQFARVVKTLEDSPFYTRSIIETSLLQRRCVAVHESLSLDRFAQPIVKAMLPFRMPRVYWK